MTDTILEAPIEQQEAVTLTGATAQTTSLQQCIEDAMKNYFKQLDGQKVTDVYDMVLAEVEEPLLKIVMGHTKGNQTKAAKLLGLSRGTLRKKLKIYDID